MNLPEFAIHAFAVYAVTAILAASHIAKPARRLFRWLAWDILPFKIAGKFVKYEYFQESPDMKPILEDVEDLDLSFERNIAGYDYIACRMCVGVSVTATLWAIGWPFVTELGIYGAAYFVATQERQ